MTEYYSPDLIAYVSEAKPTEDDSFTEDYKNSTYMVVSKVAYLIGVPKRIFDNEHEAPKPEWYEQMKVNKNDVLDEAYRRTRAEMSTAEKKQFYDKHIKKMKLTIHEDGEVTIDLGT